MNETVAGADPTIVGSYLARVLDQPHWRDCSVTRIAGGKSNLTYRIDAGAESLILRRPPLGHVLPTAHDMAREYRVISALGGTAVPVPAAVHLCSDPAVLGQPFYLMSRVEGHICTTSLPPGYADTPAQRQAIAAGLIEVLVSLHAVDAGQVGLGDFGRPAGYLTRQVARWTTQWNATRIDGIDELDALAAALGDSVPSSARGGIVHGDYRLDNTLLHPSQPGRVNAVLDWEMSTLGDPLADLGMLLVYWAQADDNAVMKGGEVVPSVTALPGFPTRAQVADSYAARSGADLEELPWYVAFAYFKLAVVCAGIVARVRGGAMVGGGFDGYEERIAPLVELGHSTLADRALP